jgi:hypothetical protein
VGVEGGTNMVASLFLQPETILNLPENEGKLHMTKVQ